MGTRSSGDVNRCMRVPLEKRGFMADTAQTSFSMLLVRAREGSTSALVRLLESQRRWLKRVAFRGLPRPLSVRHDPSDLAQEGIWIASRQFAGFRGESNLRGVRRWLKGILRHRIQRWAAILGPGQARQSPRGRLNSRSRAGRVPHGSGRQPRGGSAPARACRARRGGSLSAETQARRGPLVREDRRAYRD